MSKKNVWRPMIYAPRDGTAIIALYGDCSGVDLIRWGVTDETGEEAWFHADYSDVLGDDPAGWIAAPSGIEYVGEDKMTECRDRAGADRIPPKDDAT